MEMNATEEEVSGVNMQDASKVKVEVDLGLLKDEIPHEMNFMNEEVPDEANVVDNVKAVTKAIAKWPSTSRRWEAIKEVILEVAQLAKDAAESAAPAVLSRETSQGSASQAASQAAQKGILMPKDECSEMELLELKEEIKEMELKVAKEEINEMKLMVSNGEIKEEFNETVGMGFSPINSSKEPFKSVTSEEQQATKEINTQVIMPTDDTVFGAKKAAVEEPSRTAMEEAINAAIEKAERAALKKECKEAILETTKHLLDATRPGMRSDSYLVRKVEEAIIKADFERQLKTKLKAKEKREESRLKREADERAFERCQEIALVEKKRKREEERVMQPANSLSHLEFTMQKAKSPEELRRQLVAPRPSDNSLCPVENLKFENRLNAVRRPVSALSSSELTACYNLVQNLEPLYIKSGEGWSESNKIEEMRTAGLDYIMLWSGVTLAGFVSYARHDQVLNIRGPLCYIWEIHVNYALRRHGIGRMLMNMVQDIACYDNECILLRCFRINKAARKFYTKFGFKALEKFSNDHEMFFMTTKVPYREDHSGRVYLDNEGRELGFEPSKDMNLSDGSDEEFITERVAKVEAEAETYRIELSKMHKREIFGFWWDSENDTEDDGDDSEDKDYTEAEDNTEDSMDTDDDENTETDEDNIEDEQVLVRVTRNRSRTNIATPPQKKQRSTRAKH